MRAAIYCRLSKEDRVTNGESESIQNQKSMLIQYAIEKGLDIYQIYSDEDYSGVDRSRPAFNAMIQDASEHKFDVVIAKTQSRFTRDMELVERYLHGKFPEWGIRFIAVVDHADTADQYNKKARQINGLINEWYLENLSENVRSLMRYKQLKGRLTKGLFIFAKCGIAYRNVGYAVFSCSAGISTAPMKFQWMQMVCSSGTVKSYTQIGLQALAENEVSRQ